MTFSSLVLATALSFCVEHLPKCPQVEFRDNIRKSEYIAVAEQYSSGRWVLGINNAYSRILTEEETIGVIIHEMTHFQMFAAGKYDESHGRTFTQTCKENGGSKFCGTKVTLRNRP